MTACFARFVFTLVISFRVSIFYSSFITGLVADYLSLRLKKLLCGNSEGVLHAAFSSNTFGVGTPTVAGYCCCCVNRSMIGLEADEIMRGSDPVSSISLS